MSSVFIISIIIAVLVLLVSYAFIIQTLENKRKQRQRLITGLKQRSNNFQYMLSGIPEGFLTSELTEFLYRCLIDITQQLIKIDSKEQAHKDALAAYQQQLETSRAQHGTKPAARLENPEQIKEVRSHLHELHSFIEKLQQKGAITLPQAKSYSQQIRKLIFQISVDGYMAFANHASQHGKTRLTLHYYNLARQQLAKAKNQPEFAAQLEQLDAEIPKLEKKLREEGQQPTEEPTPVAPEASKEWEKFEDAELGWKKKSIYD